MNDSVSNQVATKPPRTARRSGGRSVLAVSLVVALMAGCAATTIKHGHHFNDNDINQVQPGMSQDAVRNALGTPDTTSAVPSGNAFYYISSTRKEVAFYKPEEVDRRVVAIYFNRVGSVEQVAHYGMKDGRVFDYVSRETPAHMRDRNFISRFFRGVGPKQKAFDDS
jgi:outer membrane protein assembly factor BamE (lipoprotein component of BamABCDE complex)